MVENILITFNRIDRFNSMKDVALKLIKSQKQIWGNTILGKAF